MTTLADAPATRVQMAAAATFEDNPPDPERRFGALRRLYGDAGYARLRAARFAIVGLGGVGSWAAEALARCGVAELVLIDLDHIAESNINRQVQALTSTIGQAKGQALRERIALIHPECRVWIVEAFVAEDNWPGLLRANGAGLGDPGGDTQGRGTPDEPNSPHRLDGLIDACDQVRAKETLARWSLGSGVPCIVVGAAGGRQRAEAVQVADLAEVTHDPLLAALRHRLRRAGVIARHGGAKERKAGLSCVFSREPVAQPRGVPRVDDAARGIAEESGAASTDDAKCDNDGGTPGDGTLNCHGYGSSVMVTATFGMVAAGAAVSHLLASR